MKKTCEFCGGSGQINFFKGVSRFLLSTEECPECAGLGFSIDPDRERQEKKNRGKAKKAPGRKKQE